MRDRASTTARVEGDATDAMSRVLELFARRTSAVGASARGGERGRGRDDVDDDDSNRTVTPRRDEVADGAGRACAGESLASGGDEDDSGRRPVVVATYGRRKRARATTTTTTAGSIEGVDEGDEGESDGDVRAQKVSEGANAIGKKRTQMCLDLGQASMRHETCARCGFLYAKGDPADEKAHVRYHANFVNGLSSGGVGGMTLKPADGQKVVWESENSDVRCVALDIASKASKGAMARIARGIERELCMPENWICENATGALKAFVCVVKKGNRVVGALFAEKVSEAYRTLPGAKLSSNATDGTVVAHGNKPERALCGVRAIWTHASARRRGYARAMLNSMRAHLVVGYVVDAKECAFTQPTEAGTALALSYCEDETFLVY